MLIPDIREQGYNCSMIEEEDGARLIVRRKGTVIGEIEVGNVGTKLAPSLLDGMRCPALVPLRRDSGKKSGSPG